MYGSLGFCKIGSERVIGPSFLLTTPRRENTLLNAIGQINPVTNYCNRLCPISDTALNNFEPPILGLGAVS